MLHGWTGCVKRQIARANVLVTFKNIIPLFLHFTGGMLVALAFASGRLALFRVQPSGATRGGASEPLALVQWSVVWCFDAPGVAVAHMACGESWGEDQPGVRGACREGKDKIHGVGS